MKEIRRERIKEIIEQKGNVTIEELAGRFQVSDMTIYRDLKLLQREGVLEQVRGGAILAKRDVHYSYEFNAEQRLFQAQKKAIAKRALSFIQPGMGVIFDNSSTALEAAKLLRGFKGLTAFATSQAILNELSANTDSDVYCCGGLYSRKTDSFMGSAAERFLERVQAGVCLIGAMGLSVKDGLTDPLPSEASLKRKIIERSKTVVVLADSNKIGRAVMERVAGLEHLDYLITDWEIDPKRLEELKRYVNVIVCERE